MTQFSKILTIWFEQNKRDLPWRENNNPYSVWISEIILQQTRVEQGIPCYWRFMNRFPDIQSLATASETEVLRIWQGLGYYSRARNLHKAARQIMQDFNGKFPESWEQIRKLKGIGDYTAAAIASISFGLPHAVLDGNVFRVLSRIFGIHTPIDTNMGKKEFSALANSLLDKRRPAAFNEAMMDFGALQCKPKNPDCKVCPFETSCQAFKLQQVELLPVKSKKTTLQNRFFNFLLIRYGDSVFLQKREKKDIWQNLYQLPLIETQKDSTVDEIILSGEFKEIFSKSNPVIQSFSPKVTHLLSHQKLNIRFVNITIEQPLIHTGFLQILPQMIPNFPLPKPIENYFKKVFNKSDLS